MSCECGGDRDHELTMGTERGATLGSGLRISEGNWLCYDALVGWLW